MCDDCDRSVHTYCLNPPLAAVPEEDPWFCPDCRAVRSRGEYQQHQRKRHLSRDDMGSIATYDSMLLNAAPNTAMMRAMDAILPRAINVGKGITPRGRGRPPGTGKKQQSFLMGGSVLGKPMLENKGVGRPPSVMGALKLRKPSLQLQQKMHQQQQLEEANAVAAAAAARILSKRAAGIDNALAVIQKLGTPISGNSKSKGASVSVVNLTSQQLKARGRGGMGVYKWSRDDLLLLDQLRTWGTLQDLESALAALRTRREQLIDAHPSSEQSNGHSIQGADIFTGKETGV